MYLWKYWRETRIVFGASLLAIAVLFVLILREHLVIDNRRPDQLFMVLPLSLYLQAIPISFLGWLLGSFGVGRDLGERSGSYLFSRPKSRARFVWMDWGFGISQLLVIVVAINLALWFQIHRVLAAAGEPSNIDFVFLGKAMPLGLIFCLTCCAAFLLAGLIFSLTYFSTVLIKSSKGAMLAAGCLLGYLILGAMVKHYWPGFELPGLLLREFQFSHHTFAGFADHLGLSMAIRAVIILLFPFAAQFVLEKADI